MGTGTFIKESFRAKNGSSKLAYSRFNLKKARYIMTGSGMAKEYSPDRMATELRESHSWVDGTASASARKETEPEKDTG